MGLRLALGLEDGRPEDEIDGPTEAVDRGEDVGEKDADGVGDSGVLGSRDGTRVDPADGRGDGRSLGSRDGIRIVPGDDSSSKDGTGVNSDDVDGPVVGGGNSFCPLAESPPATLV